MDKQRNGLYQSRPAVAVYKKESTETIGGMEQRKSALTGSITLLKQDQVATKANMRVDIPTASAIEKPSSYQSILVPKRQLENRLYALYRPSTLSIWV